MPHSISPVVYEEVEQLDERSAALFHAEMLRRGKSGFWAFVCAVFGLHYAYLGRWGLLVVYWMTLGGMGIWWFVDLLRVGGLVRDRNTDEALAVLRDVRGVRG